MSKKNKIIAITGSIGTGKSSAAKIFEELGAIIIDADILARKVVEKDSHALKQISEKFGNEYLTTDGQLDRAKLGNLIFSNPQRKIELEDILHPLINNLFKVELNKALSQHTNKTIAYVVPLYFESRFDYPEIEKVVVVASSKQKAIERIMLRDNCPLEIAQKKYSSQIPIEEKIKAADYVIYNDGDLEDLKKNAEAVFKQIS